MASVQDGGVVGDTKKTLGLGTSDPPLVLEVLNALIITREAQPPTVWEDAVWRHGVGSRSLTGTALETSSVALINPGSSGAAIRVHRVRIAPFTGNVIYGIREGPIGEFITPVTTDWADFGKAGDPAALVDTLSKVGTVTSSQVRERVGSTDFNTVTLDTPYVLHPLQALIVNPTAVDEALVVSFWFEQFRSSSQF